MVDCAVNQVVLNGEVTGEITLSQCSVKLLTVRKSKLCMIRLLRCNQYQKTLF